MEMWGKNYKLYQKRNIYIYLGVSKGLGSILELPYNSKCL